MQTILLQIQEGLRTLVARQEGQDLVEYGLIISLIALGAIAGTKEIGDIMATLYSNINNSLA
jgi:pilus assembly protein Flp/PilA